MDDVRRWWADHLGAAVDPHGTWQAGPAVPAGRPAGTGWTERTVRLHSYGSELEATMLTPGPAGDTAGGPAVVVPFYDIETVLGRPTRRSGSAVPDPSQAMGLRLAAAGLTVMAVPWWFETAVPDDAPGDLAGRYGPPAERHREEQPMTALGRSVADLMLAVDALASLPSVDGRRIGVLGHSLGGKLALFLAALDRRITAAVVHEPGLGLAFSNWSDPWYLGERVPTDRDLDEVLALVAPRPVLLVGGGDSDGAHNRHLVERARRSWDGRPGLSLLEHDGGHPLVPHVLAACTEWLVDRLAGDRRR